jgi:hypothetical protein
MITNEQLYDTITTVIENVMSVETEKEKADNKLIETLRNVFNSATQEISLYIINYDDDTGDYDKVADNVFAMVNNRQVLNYTVVRYSDYDMGIIAVITKK